ncbi:hypothetical protein HaLaN_20073 [Haematococcus lacustris]|uniref:Uncharacterized protein n=1 Tax=Haematococcus lacustris TaxID=44745 RepID=A0A699ZWF7_HAELA|nr:hypothetical protein HaLaN_20073 [Haematococcus lacustris]
MQCFLLVTPAIGPAIHFLTPSLIRCMRGGLVAGGIPCRVAFAAVGLGNSRIHLRQARGAVSVLGCFEDQHQTHTSPRVSQAAVHQGNQPLKTVSWRFEQLVLINNHVLWCVPPHPHQPTPTLPAAAHLTPAHLTLPTTAHHTLPATAHPTLPAAAHPTLPTAALEPWSTPAGAAANAVASH